MQWEKVRGINPVDTMQILVNFSNISTFRLCGPRSTESQKIDDQWVPRPVSLLWIDSWLAYTACEAAAVTYNYVIT